MSVEDVETLFSVASVVVADPRPDGALQWARRLADDGFSGPVLDVADTARATRPLGLLIWPQAEARARLAALHRHGCRLVVVLGPGGAHGAADADARKALRAEARALGMRLLGPSRLGVVSPRDKLALSGWDHMPAQGHLGLVARSDSLVGTLLAAAEREAIGLSRAVSLGETGEDEMADVLDALAGDAATRAVLLHLDRVRRPRAFLSAARAASRVKPIAYLRTGRAHDPAPTGRLAPAALLTHARVLDAALARAGLSRADTLEALIDTAEILGAGRAFSPPDPAAAPRVAIVANGTGPAEIAAEAALARGAALMPGAGDLGVSADAPAFLAAIDAFVEARAADVVVVLVWPAPASAGSGLVVEDLARGLVDLAARRSSYRPARLVAVLLGASRADTAEAILRAGDVPAYETPERAVRAALAEIEHVRRQAALHRLPTPIADDARPYVPMLRAFARGAAGAATEPRVLAGDEVTPLLDVLDVAPTPGMAPAARALTVALLRDPVFGPVVLIAPAGRAAPDTPAAVALPPLDDALARLALAELRLGREMAARRPEDASAIVRVLVALAEIAAEVPGIAEIVIDGLDVVGGRPVASGAELVVDPARLDATPGADLAILPYPRHLERLVTLRDGRSALMRPIRPEDARMMQRLFHRMTPEDRRMRLFVPVRELSDATAARMTQIDYDREMCLVIEDPSAPGELLAGARFVCDAQGTEAEYAVTVRSDCKGLGLGRLVLGAVLDCARARGVERVWGTVLAGNRGMLALAAKLGMRASIDPDDQDLVKTEIRFV